MEVEKEIIYVGNNSYIIPAWASDYVLTLIKSYSVCESCNTSFSEENYEAAHNTCLRCVKNFLVGFKNQQIDYLHHAIKTILVNGKEKEIVLTFFLNQANGHILRVQSDQGFYSHYSDHYLDIEETAKWWGFLLPTVYDEEGKELTYTLDVCALYGDFQSQSVIVFCYDDRKEKDEGVSGTFAFYLLYKGAGCLNVTEKHLTGQASKIAYKAHKWADTQKDEDGKYTIPDVLGKNRLNYKDLRLVMAFYESVRFDIEGTM